MRNIFVCVLLFLSISVVAQNIYKTPSGEKYHLSSCRMVENVSKKLLDAYDISKYNLTPCKICKPPFIDNINGNYNASNKAVGTSMSVRCKGYTQKGTRCKHKTKLANGYCYQHTKQNSSSSNSYTRSYEGVTTTCGARNKSGGNCKRKVKGGGYCYQHN